MPFFSTNQVKKSKYSTTVKCNKEATACLQCCISTTVRCLWQSECTHLGLYESKWHLHVLESFLKFVGVHTMTYVENRTIKCVFGLLSANPFHVCFSDKDKDQLMSWLTFSSSLPPNVLLSLCYMDKSMFAWPGCVGAPSVGPVHV